VTDGELIVLASVLGVTADQLYPENLLKRYRAKKIKAKRIRLKIGGLGNPSGKKVTQFPKRGMS
jgi:hypothetical protein